MLCAFIMEDTHFFQKELLEDYWPCFSRHAADLEGEKESGIAGG